MLMDLTRMAILVLALGALLTSFVLGIRIMVNVPLAVAIIALSHYWLEPQPSKRQAR